MSRLQDLGRRVELQSMDPHCHNISIALYREFNGTVPEYTVHSYSELPGTAQRVLAIANGMQRLGALQSRQTDTTLQFACGNDHPLAVRRTFLECCKLADPSQVPAGELSIVDRKSGLTIVAHCLGEGQYRITADVESAVPTSVDQGAKRVAVIVNGLRKLGEMLPVQDADGNLHEDCVSFSCGQDHHPLVGLLLQRAPNVRALVREQEAAAARGVLAAPSAQS